MSIELSEHGVKQSIIWIEAIIDAHMNSIAIDALHNESTRVVLKSLLTFISDLQEPLIMVENIMSMSLHISRMSAQIPFNPYNNKNITIDTMIENKMKHSKSNNNNNNNNGINNDDHSNNTGQISYYYSKGEIVYTVEKLII